MRLDAYRRWNFTNESHQPNYIDGTMFLITVWIQLPPIIDYSEPTSKFRKLLFLMRRLDAWFQRDTGPQSLGISMVILNESIVPICILPYEVGWNSNFSFKKNNLKTSSSKYRVFFLFFIIQYPVAYIFSEAIIKNECYNVLQNDSNFFLRIG